MPRVSVIIPIYNSERTLQRCLDSVTSQTFDDYELILVNDGSTDDSIQIVNRYRTVSKVPVQVFEQSNKGQASARNLGMTAATGEFIQFVDSDDTIDPGMMDEMVRMALSQDADIVVCDLSIDFPEQEYRNHTVKGIDFNNSTTDIKKAYIISDPSPCNKLFKRSLFTENRLRFPEGWIYEDLAIIPLIGLYAQRIAYVPKPFYKYAMIPSSTMNNKTNIIKLDLIFPVMDFLNKEFALRGFAVEYASELEFLYIDHLLFAASYRYLGMKNGGNSLQKIRQSLRNSYPSWMNNIHLKNRSRRYRLICRLFYYGMTYVVRVYRFLKR